MTRRNLFSALFPLLLLTAPLAACSKADASVDSEAKQVTAASPDETKTLVAQGATLVDVREKDEVEDGKITSALVFPFSSASDSAVWADFTSKLPKDKPVVLYCASGGRAQRLGERLAKEGFQVRNAGGYSALAKAGMPSTEH